MSALPGRARWPAALLALGLLASPAQAQEWRATAQVGRVTTEGAAPGAGAGASLVLGIARSAPRDWLSLSSALPVNGDPFWASVGGWKRFATRGSAGVLLDLSAHGFVQRFTSLEEPAPAPTPIPLPGSDVIPREVAVSGAGAGAEALGGVRAAAGALALELRGGASGQRSKLGGETAERLLPTADARVTLVRLPVALGGETRAWWKDGERHAYAGGSLRVIHGPIQLWGSAGRWVSDGVPGVVWGAGARTGIGPLLELQLTARGNGFDPVYLTRTGTSVAVGMSMRLGGAAAGTRAPVPARYADGRAEVRIPARGIEGRPSIAGDFTGWKPAPMERDGNRWVWRGKLAPGTYHYAFVDADGKWFVPASVPGRRDDGMGGHVAVLVVAS